MQIGIARAPVTDWRGYDSAYTERYLGCPVENAKSYELSSPLSLVNNFPDEYVLPVAGARARGVGGVLTEQGGPTDADPRPGGREVRAAGELLGRRLTM